MKKTLLFPFWLMVNFLNYYRPKMSMSNALVVLVVFCMLLELLPNVEGKKKFPKCSVCKTITDDFKTGLDKTVKSNYGGGNTNWEEKALGSYAKSEIRLVEVMEFLCKGGDKECHHLLEEHEELVEKYWFEEFGKKDNLDIYKWLCIEQIKACCPENTYGPNCIPCTGGAQRPCSGNGNCDGNGTRKGKGTCSCYHGYKGDLCDDCSDDHFEESRNTTHVVCQKCDQSCKSGCYQAGPTGCEECNTGYELIDETCTDINECTSTTKQSDNLSVCEEGKECVNNEGSFTCIDIPKETETEDENVSPDDENTESDDIQNDDESQDENKNDILDNIKDEL